MFNLLKKVIGTANDREISRLAPRVDVINALEPKIKKLSDATLAAKTNEFKERLTKGEDLESIVEEAFAVVREAGARVLNQRHFDVQLIGGLVLHQGKIAEMKTGEGKTLAATLPVYLNALTGKGVHVVTVNDYLARRDAEWMGQIYSFLGLTTGVIVHGLSDEERRESYHRDITYGTNNEFGFDYLRDNMKFSNETLVQRQFNFAIVDEVDSILIDEARTPLIISGHSEESTELYGMVNRVIPKLETGKDYTLDEKTRASNLTEEGVAKAEAMLNVQNLYDPKNMDILHHLDQALKAHTLFQRDKDYIVKEGQVVIVDEFTGRLMPGRRYSDGLHQALEAKERVKIENENQTMASITFQNYFRMYDKLSGMTGTADTEAAEFAKIYNLEVVVIPTHRKMIRSDHSDVIFRTMREKYEAVVAEITDLYQRGQPVLVGTISINNSELVSNMLKVKGIPHQVLNAKHHEMEAQIVALAGQPGTVTISTNMAGRGTDIVLGPGVPNLGGLFILGTERHESRRIDNQLRGRSGRQGDPGESRFYLSLEDDLLRIFGGDRFKGILARIGMSEGVQLESAMISKGIQSAQKQVENRNFEIRKHLLEYDDVMNRQREIIYRRRRHILSTTTIFEDLVNLIDEESQALVMIHLDSVRDVEDWNWTAFSHNCHRTLGFIPDRDQVESLEGEARLDYLYDLAKAHLLDKRQEFTEMRFNEFGRWIMLYSLDNLWKDHLLNMDHLKDGIGLRGYAQKDPLREYQREGFEMFEEMVAKIRSETLSYVNHVKLAINSEADEAPMLPMKPKKELKVSYSRGGGSEESLTPQPERRISQKIGRNDPCPCGSGKKYKHCHGAS
ncbi:MAG: preprotein translocase subunit SecA [Deltaproteobacteria bacterium]|jgi:preprotein translocase subunit SecA|nr:preprotein translocase subunit SecA [Deltaproteobacteria bacterium]